MQGIQVRPAPLWAMLTPTPMLAGQGPVALLALEAVHDMVLLRPTATGHLQPHSG